MIIRPQNTLLPLSLSEEWKIKNDIFRKDPANSEADGRAIHQGYIFVAATSERMFHWHPLTRSLTKASGLAKIFALR